MQEHKQRAGPCPTTRKHIKVHTWDRERTAQCIWITSLQSWITH